MKCLLVLIALAFLSFSLHAQNNSISPEASSVAVAQVPSGVATFTNGVLTHLHAATNISVTTEAGAILKPNATANSATHSNFKISSAWLVAFVPVILALLKTLAPKIPRQYLPIIAPVLGAALDAGTSYLSGNTVNPVLGAVLGSAGVGLREIYDQIKASSTTPPSAGAATFTAPVAPPSLGSLQSTLISPTQPPKTP